MLCALLGTEYDTTASNVSYNLYKDGEQVAKRDRCTNFAGRGPAPHLGNIR